MNDEILKYTSLLVAYLAEKVQPVKPTSVELVARFDALVSVNRRRFYSKS